MKTTDSSIEFDNIFHAATSINDNIRQTVKVKTILLFGYKKKKLRTIISADIVKEADDKNIITLSGSFKLVIVNLI